MDWTGFSHDRIPCIPGKKNHSYGKIWERKEEIWKEDTFAIDMYLIGCTPLTVPEWSHSEPQIVIDFLWLRIVSEPL